MTLEFISQIIEEIYYTGRVKTDRKLTREDFLQYGKTAYASLIRVLFFNLRSQNEGMEYHYIGNMLKPRKFPLPAGTRKRVIDLSKHPMVVLPLNSHIFNMDLLGCDCETGPTMIAPGEERFYRGPDFSHYKFFDVEGQSIRTFNFPDCITEVEVSGVWDDDDKDVPADIAFDIINQVLGLTLKVAGFPVDKTDDNDPNVTTVKQRLNVPQV
jgi:hypothetical protein